MLTETEKDELSRLITATYEVLGQSITAVALNFMVADLSQYSVESINNALASCRREVKGRFNLAEIINRIDGEDGRLMANEAWSIACHLENESESGAVTRDILAAKDVADECPDQVSGRMAFIEAYNRLCKQSRDRGEPSEWFVSLGTDKARRIDAVKQAVASHRITQDKANALIPDLRESEGTLTNLIESAVKESGNNEYARKALDGLKELVGIKPKYNPKQISIEDQIKYAKAKAKDEDETE